MRIDQAKTVPIDQYLAYEGYRPAKVRNEGTELFYHSPIRQGDNSPSFKVDTIINKWYDHGISKGGNIVDLAIELHRCDVKDALKYIERSHLFRSDHPQLGFQHIGKIRTQKTLAFEKEKRIQESFKLISESSLKHPALLQYLEQRKINLNIAQKYLKEIHFEASNGGKRYFALGWRNGMGFEARNKLFKGCVGTSRLPTYLKKQNAPLCLVFEGFMDFLSYLTENQLLEPYCSVIVLNTASLKRQALNHIIDGKYSAIELYLDNDKAGNECVSYYQNTLKTLNVTDRRSEYAGFKDYNAKVMSLSS